MELMTTDPTRGTRATCAACGERIVFVGPYWDHEGDLRSYHTARP